MKYVILRAANGHTYPVIFPNSLAHKEIADALGPLLPGTTFEVKSAGFINSMQVIGNTLPGSSSVCYGDSETLAVKSLGLPDDDLIKTSDYYS
jgi:hypothetical protein